LPSNDSSAIYVLDIPPKDIEEYAKIYRWFPNFAEAEM
jgi:hypothetical protein